MADAVLLDFPEPPDFNWGEGVLMAGMMRAFEQSGDSRYLEFVRRWADHWKERGLSTLLEARGYCGHWGPGLAVLRLGQRTGDPSYLELARSILGFMTRVAERTADGGLSHFNGKVQLWVDTLFMCCPVLSLAASLEGRAEYQDEAVRQLLVFSRHLQDPETGLYYHMYDEASDTRTEDFWARGNGWVAMSFLEVLRGEPPGSPRRAQLIERFSKQIRGIILRQDAGTGLWHTVLDAPNLYLETSASAMFLYAMVEAHNLGLDVEIPRESVRRAWEGLQGKVDPDGRVVGVSAGTGPTNREGYAKIPVGVETWGTGAWLLAASALSENRDVGER